MTRFNAMVLVVAAILAARGAGAEGPAQTTAPEFKPGIPGLKMADVRDHKHLWREIEELQTWERADRISVAEYRSKVIEKTAQFLGLDGAAAEEFTATASGAIAGMRESFRAGRRPDTDPADAQARLSSDLGLAVARVTALLRKEPRHELFAPECRKWLLRLAFGPTEAKEARETAGAGKPLELPAIDPPAAPGSTQPAIAAEGATTASQEHEILMTWLEPGGRFMFARLCEGEWSRPVTIAERVSVLDPTDAPSLTVIETQGVRRTLLARAGDVVARSGNGGRTWTRLPASRLPFASFAGGDEGAYAFWLEAGGAGPAKLLGARVLAGGTLLDPVVAAGSGTSAAMTWDGPVVVYRDLSSEGAPEICIVRRQDARWTAPLPVLAAASSLTRALKSGPEVAARRRQVAVAWVTQTPRPRLQVAFSEDAGRTFAAPVELRAAAGAGEPSGPVAVALDAHGHALVLWLAGGPAEATLKLARLLPDGRRGDPLVLARASAARIDHPRIALAGDRIAVSWVEGGFGDPSGRVRALAVPLAAVPELGSPGEPQEGSAPHAAF